MGGLSRNFSNQPWTVSNGSRLCANNPFRRYIREPVHEVRQSDVTGQSFADQVKRTRQMLRSMKPEAVKQVIEFHKGLNFFQALALAKREGRLIVPNDVHDRILNETELRYRTWTGTLVIYETPYTQFGEQIVFDNMRFFIPKKFRGKINCALLIEHPDFELVNLGGNKYELKAVDEANINLIEDFPVTYGEHKLDKIFGIPIGHRLNCGDNSTRWFLRSNNEGIYFLVRGVSSTYDDGSTVSANWDIQYRFGVALF